MPISVLTQLYNILFFCQGSPRWQIFVCSIKRSTYLSISSIPMLAFTIVWHIPPIRCFKDAFVGIVIWYRKCLCNMASIIKMDLMRNICFTKWIWNCLSAICLAKVKHAYSSLHLGFNSFPLYTCTCNCCLHFFHLHYLSLLCIV